MDTDPDTVTLLNAAMPIMLCTKLKSSGSDYYHFNLDWISPVRP
ncbi:hypothetical protein T4E_3756 [Trichinella pseudospiralis]|uniref:Uncharacterized protein n=1 Tax=Trichinella pseudospiralis TaxID=6337 RepID=A0A0V0WGF0_TRIPS|nr:hypothetical protein T4E_3756 [Trichinella pseudospiralis]